MLFNIEADSGSEIAGYLVPDSFSDTPRLCLHAGGALLWHGEASEPRAALVAAGRHATGRCGFRIGPAEVPGLAALADLELREPASGLCLYRRAGGRRLVGQRIFRLETRLLADSGFDRAMEPHFQAWHSRIEHFGAETINQLFLLHGIASSYASGRVQVPAHPALTDGSVTVMLQLRDPFEELAERIAVLAGARGPLARHLTVRERLALHGAAAALDGLDPGSARAVRRLFRRLEPGVAAALSNPLARQLTTASPGDLCAPAAVAAGLRALAGFEIVSTGELPGYFEAAAAALLELPPPAPMRDPHAAETAEIADALAGISAVQAMLECDLEIYASVSGVFDGLASGTSQG
ncbi:hypothetical protein LNKW23_00210 [Paralimibaculum aggregatum]|uniref:Uncharacterized protein n=1 Tax=Paralimibaculum aggregatum TaxID=3036245 RepID=A0ABQ6LBM2_9RHOB|nr:hypothetical protein [Limibaculum sp. NKW23]GMG80809.1 hypothetical protein LNKW23_00210 [Limibaculum sp. NKW23]